MPQGDGKIETFEASLAEALMFSFMELGRLGIGKGPTEKLRHAECAVMMTIQASCSQEGLKTSEIATNLRVAAPSVTPILNRLESRGYLVRKTHARDRRVVQVSLTQEGEAVLNETTGAVKAQFSALTGYLGEEDTTHLLRLLRRIRDFCAGECDVD